MAEDDIEIKEMDGYGGEKDMEFSHQALVMRALKKCLENGAREMRSGYFNEKRDRFGNQVRTYVEDTRKVFIESVETLKMIISCDMDEKAEEIIKVIDAELHEKFEKLCGEEEIDWKNSLATIKQNRWGAGIYYRVGCLNKELPYYQDYIENEVRAARKVVTEIGKLTKRLDFYREEDFEA